MLFDRKEDEAKHRIIGIRHVLKRFKGGGLIEDDTLYPERAVKEVSDRMLKVAQTWYRIGARRGAIRILEAFLDGHLSVEKEKGGSLSVITTTNDISWKRVLKVRVGNKTTKLPKTKYELTTKELGFR